MKLNYYKHLFLSICFICALSLTTIYFDAAQSNTHSTGNQIDDTKEELDKYNEQEDDLENDLKNLNQNLQSLANEMNELETEIAATQQEIAATTIELQDATLLANKQQEEMKSRIQFMYEQGNTSLLVTLLESDSFTDFLNKAEYISFITSYDRTKLNEYQQLLSEISQKKATLEADESSLLAMKDEMQQKQSNVNALIKETQGKLDETQSEIASLERKIKEWEEYEKKLEEEKIEEDLNNWDEIQDIEDEDWEDVEYEPQEGEAYLLAAIIQCEAESEPYLGKIAVGNVVLNRVKSSSFPNTITGVIYQTKQFSPVASGRLAYRLEAGVNAECIQAATEVLNGKHVIDALFFRMNNGKINGTIIGNHVFY
ncbi:MAG: cell wall hydrolase [Agathobacter sp.]|nr:cell wall hydrolase [Agathobacter sp.]